MQTVELLKNIAKLIGTDQVTFRSGTARIEHNGVTIEVSTKDTRGLRGTYSIADLESIWSELRRLSEAKALLESLGYRVYRRGSEG